MKFIKIMTRNITTSAKLQTENTNDYTFKVVEKYKFFSNDLRKQAMKYNFDKNKIFSEEDNLTSEEKYYKERINLSDENKELHSDLDLAIKAKSAIEKISNNITPKKSEFTGLKKIEDKYESFFDSDEESDEDLNDDKNSLDEKNEVENSIQRVDNVVEYIKEELSINKSHSRNLGKTYKGKGKRKIEYSSSEESSPSKKSRTSTNEFIDELPQEYDPFDDLGVD